MAETVPIGKREDLHLEFKARDAIRDPAKIARAVVGMLNADGGDVWVGVREDRGVAVEVEGIADPVRAARLLADHFLETIEPQPRDEIDIEPVPSLDGRVALHVRAKPSGSRRPYAYVRKGGRHFVVRVGDRLRYLAREELFRDRVGGDAIAQAWNRVRITLEDELGRALEDRTPRLWLGLQPVGEVRIPRDPALLEYLVDPAKTGNRSTGWTFWDPHEQPNPTSGRIVYGRSDYRRTEVRDDGGIRFTVPLEHLYWKGPRGMLWPYPLAEYPVSILRLASRLYRSTTTPDNDRVAVRLALIAVEGCTLKAGSPNTVQWTVEDPKAFPERDLVTPILEQRWRDIIDAPDRCAYPLVKAVYEAFGFRDDAIIPEFDPVDGLKLPS